MLIVITDGTSSTGYEPEEESLALQDQRVNVFGIGVGKGVDEAELSEIASDPQNILILKSFARILDVVADISSKACDAPTGVTGKILRSSSRSSCTPALFCASLLLAITVLSKKPELIVVDVFLGFGLLGLFLA